MTIYKQLCRMTPEQRVARIGCVDRCLLALPQYTPAEIACQSCGTWACPAYLGPALGFAFDCKAPATADQQVCRKCTEEFFRMHWH